MTKTNKGLLIVSGCLLAFGVFFIWYVLHRLDGNDGAIALNQQLQTVISAHDKDAIHKISDDQETEQFLLALPKNTTVQKTSGAQGGPFFHNGGVGWVYYATMIQNHQVNVYMKEDIRSFPYSFWPKWTIYKASLNMPSIHDDFNRN